MTEDASNTETSERMILPRLRNHPVIIPLERRHESGTGATPPGVLLALIVATVGGVALGAGYGAFLALCGKIFVNIPLAFAFAFWLNVPAQMGLMWGRVRTPAWRFPVELAGLSACLYAICVGWLAGVLDGPGVVFHPLTLAGHLIDVSNHGIWVNAWGLENDLHPLRPYFLLVRFGSFLWLVKGGLMTLGAETPYPYCQTCRKWMSDEAKMRVQYEPTSSLEPDQLALNLARGEYEQLFTLDQPVSDKTHGLELNVFSCERCVNRHVLNVTWHRNLPDENQGAFLQAIEQRTGKLLIENLLVPLEVQSHVTDLSRRDAA